VFKRNAPGEFLQTGVHNPPCATEQLTCRRTEEFCSCRTWSAAWNAECGTRRSSADGPHRKFAAPPGRSHSTRLGPDPRDCGSAGQCAHRKRSGRRSRPDQIRWPEREHVECAVGAVRRAPCRAVSRVARRGTVGRWPITGSKRLPCLVRRSRIWDKHGPCQAGTATTWITCHAK